MSSTMLRSVKQRQVWATGSRPIIRVCVPISGLKNADDGRLALSKTIVTDRAMSYLLSQWNVGLRSKRSTEHPT